MQVVDQNAIRCRVNNEEFAVDELDVAGGHQTPVVGVGRTGRHNSVDKFALLVIDLEKVRVVDPFVALSERDNRRSIQIGRVVQSLFCETQKEKKRGKKGKKEEMK
jgi:hypothetical protein